MAVVSYSKGWCPWRWVLPARELLQPRSSCFLDMPRPQTQPVLDVLESIVSATPSKPPTAGPSSPAHSSGFCMNKPASFSPRAPVPAALLTQQVLQAVSHLVQQQGWPSYVKDIPVS